MPQQTKIQFQVVLILLLGWGLVTFLIGDDFYNLRDTPFVWIPSAARNYERYGIEQIGGAVVRDAHFQDDISQLHIYSHHPPLLAWLPALFSRVAGESELALRFIPSAITMLSFSLFYVLVRRLYNKSIAIVALFLFVANPMVLYFLSGFGHDTYGIAAAIAYTTIFINWLRKPVLIRFTALIIMTILCVWTAWPAVFFVATIGVAGMFLGNNQHRIGVVILGIVSIASFLIMMLLYELWSPTSITSILDAFIWRTSTASNVVDSESFSLLQWLYTTIIHIGYYGTFGILLLSVWGLHLLTKRSNKVTLIYVVSLFLSGLLYIIVFRNASYVHVYYKAFLMPALCISAAFVVTYLRKSVNLRKRALIDGLLFSIIIQGIFVMYISLVNPHEATLKQVVEFINDNHEDAEVIYILFPEAFYRSNLVIEYYTDVKVNWNLFLEELSETEEDFLYILCFDEQTYINNLFDELPQNTRINNLCTAYYIDTLPQTQ